MNRLLLYAALFIASALAFSLLWIKSSQAYTASNIDWPRYGNDLGNTRFQDVDQINPENVKRLKVAWVFHTGVLDPKASLEVSPVVIGGTMFVTSGHDDVFALNATTGTKLWEHHPQLLAPLAKLHLCCGEDNRGVAFGSGKVFIARVDGVLEALDAQTGHEAWKTVVADYRDRYTLTMAPQFVNGLVIVGTSGGEYIARGEAAAFDAESGKEVWRTFTASAGPTWAGDSWKRGGAHVWQTPAADPSLGLLFINTGNAGNDINGFERAGANLYSSSIVALNTSDGQVRWAFQEVHHDLWDYDSAQPVVLFDLTRDGKTYPALGECSKNGNYYILDRRTGMPLYPVREMRVATDPEWQHAFPTQPVSSVEPLTPLSILPGTIDFNKLPAGIGLASQYTPPQERTIVIEPGDDGGCEMPPAAYSPRTKYVYYGARYEPAVYKTFRTNDGPDSKGAFLGSKFAEKIPGVTDFGIFGATDTISGKVVWKIRVAQPAKSGVLVAGDLMFFGEGNGKFHAVNARTGAVLFTFDGTDVPHGGGAQAAPIAYVADGKEFIVNAFGGNVADAQFAPNPIGDAIVAFALQ